MRTTLLLSLFLIVVISIVSGNTEKRSDKPPVHKVIEGHSLSFECNATESEDVEIFWMKNDTKLQFRENGTELNFTNIDRKFAGDYVCYSFNLTAENETEANATVVEVINIDVLYPAKVTQFYLAPTAITGNKTFRIDFAIEGNPDPIFSIMNNRTKQSMVEGTIASSGSITSWPARCEDAGFWMCSGHNSLNHGVNTTWGANLTVYCSPKPNLDHRIDYHVRTRPGKFATLVMYNLGHPSPYYSWAFNGTVLPNNMHWDNGTYSILNIPYVQVKHFKDFGGKYTLTMSNSVGSYSADYELVPDGGPEAPTQLTFSDVTSNSVTLHWRTGYDMGYQQHFIIFNSDGHNLNRISDEIFDYSHNHGVGNNFTYVLKKLQPSTHYKLTLSANNGFANISYCQEWAEFTTLYSSDLNYNLMLLKRTSHYDGTFEYQQHMLWLKTAPPEMYARQHKKAIIIGCSVGGFVFIGLMAFLVYMVKYRHMQTTYETNRLIGKK